MSKTLRISVVVLLAVMFAFSADAARLTIQVNGSGTTNPSPGRYSCGIGQTVNILAIPSAGWKFSHWSGNMGGSMNPDSITMWFSNRTVTANFVQLPPLSPETALQHYMAEVDGNYAWNCYKTTTMFPYTNYFIAMTSHQWRNANEVDRPLWTHYIIIQAPWFHSATCLMLIDGGSNTSAPPQSADSMIGWLAVLTNYPVAMLKQIPNQPLYFADENNVRRTEDSLLAYSFDKYMSTGDYKWNGHLPMTKASVLGMDTIQRQLSGVNRFFLIGASKRGWTTWLVAATDDSRISGFVPIVIPILNVEAQMDHHWESYGFYAPAVGPYEEFDLFCEVKTPQGQDWLKIEDPYEYFNTSSVIANKPKLIINAAGDQFFMPDALRFYWDDIPGPGTKHVRIVPNASHGFEEDENMLMDALLPAIAWADRVKDGNPLPVYSWTVGANSITLTCGSTPDVVRLWQATNPNGRDFRVEEIGTVWTSTTLYNQGNNTYIANCPAPAQGWSAFLVEMEFGSQKYTTEIIIRPDTLPFQGTHCL